MAKNILLEKDGERKKVPIGFSWTVFFFGFFVPLFRKDYAWGFAAFIFGFAGAYLIHEIAIFAPGILFPLFYNKIYVSKLLEDGWMPVDEYGSGLLRVHRIIK